MVVEVIGGLISGSLALLADAVHMLTDAFALVLAISAQWISSRPADSRLHFGYRRTQVLAAFVNGIALLGLLGWIIFEAIARLGRPVDVAWEPMLGVAVVGLAANGVAFLLLHGGDRENVNMRGAMLHVISDLLGSVAAVFAAMVIAIGGSTRIDPVLSLVVAALIAHSAFRLLKETGHILLEGAPKNINVDDLVADLKASDAAISDIHHVRIWQLTPEQPCLTLHACVSDAADSANVLSAIKERLEKKFGISASTIQIEHGDICPDFTDPVNKTNQHKDSTVKMPNNSVSGPIIAAHHQ